MYHDGMTSAATRHRVYTVEEARNLPPPSEELLCRRREIMDEVLRQHEAYLAAGGKVMTQEEFEELWDDIDP